MAKVAVIIAAAGKGERFGEDAKKPFANLDGRPIFIRCLELFINRDDVCQTILVVAPKEMEHVKEKYAANLAFMGVQLVTGGNERFESVARGLEQVREDADLVAVHDAARPCVTGEMIDAVFAEAAKSGAAILAAPLFGTLKRVNKDGQIEETVSRERLFEAQTPQVFRRDWLTEAYERRDQVEGPITDDAYLVEGLGHPVHVVKSDATNIKITTRGDVTLASAILRAQPKAAPKGPRGPFEEAQW